MKPNNLDPITQEEIAMSTVALKSNPVNHILAGSVAGLIGGAVFGMMMGMMGMLPMVGMLVGQDNALVGLIVHMVISAVIGGLYGIAAPRIPAGWLPAVVAGAINGVIWWVLGALILMPLGLGMTTMVLVIGATQWLSLMGHLIFGIVTSLAYLPLSRRLS